MSAESLRQRLQDGQRLLGVANAYPATGIIEGMCKGWDVVWIDGQHGQMGYDAALSAIRAAAACGIESIFRVPGHDQSMLGAYADLAPSGLMIPMVNTVAQAQAIAAALQFAPKGIRSYGGRRPIDLHGRDYYKTSPFVIAQIETVEAVQNANDIIKVDGIDMLLFGPDDMKLSMNLPVDTPPAENQQLRDAMAATARAARAAGKSCGCVAAADAAVAIAAEMGYQLIIGGADAGFLRTAAAQKLQAMQKVLQLQQSSDGKPARPSFY